MKDGDDSDYINVPTPVYKIVLLVIKCTVLFYLLGEGIYKLNKKKDLRFRPIMFVLAAEIFITLLLLLEELVIEYIYLLYYIYALESCLLLVQIAILHHTV